MFKKYLSRFTLICLILLSIQSCKKGDAGDQGPAGTANVIYSDWFTPSTYIKDTVFGIYGFRHDHAAPEITQAIIDSGTVITYGKLLGYNQAVWPLQQIAPLPILLTYKQSGTTMTDTWSAYTTAGNLRIRFTNNANDYNVISNAHQFRYIIIPGGKKASVSVTSQMSYEEVCGKLNINR